MSPSIERSIALYERSGDALQPPNGQSRPNPNATIRELLPLYLAYAAYEWNLAPRTLHQYKESICRALKVFGDITPQQLDIKAVLALKSDLASRNVSANWTRGIVNSLRSFLRFSRLVLNLNVLDPKAISLPRIPRRDVLFLTPIEVEQFVSAIPVFNPN